MNARVPTDSVHCVVTSCENPVTWRRVLQLRSQGGELIAEVSVYFCTEHRAAEAHLSEAEPFPPESATAPG